MSSRPACPACSSRVTRTNDHRTRTCSRCAAIFSWGGPMWRGDVSYYLTLRFLKGDVPAEQLRYFDFQVMEGSDLSLKRIHGWYDVESRLVVQIG